MEIVPPNLSNGSEEFKSVVEFFLWLRSTRDNEYTQPYTLEPINPLINCDDELQRLVG